MDTRPEWTPETPEPLARWLISQHITKITHHWEFTGEDTSRDWITVHSEKETRDLKTNFFETSKEFEFRPNHAGLIAERRFAKVRAVIYAIDAWERANAKDRSEFERLKVKFGASA